MLYHNKVTLSHTPVQRLGNQARNRKNELFYTNVIKKIFFFPQFKTLT